MTTASKNVNNITASGEYRRGVFLSSKQRFSEAIRTTNALSSNLISYQNTRTKLYKYTENAPPSAYLYTNETTEEDDDENSAAKAILIRDTCIKAVLKMSKENKNSEHTLIHTQKTTTALTKSQDSRYYKNLFAKRSFISNRQNL